MSPQPAFRCACWCGSGQFLKQTGLSSTVLRDNFHLDLIPELFGADGVIRGPARDGRVAWVARDDVAEVVGTILADPSRFDRTYDLTGPEALTMAETSRRLAALTGRPLAYYDETIAEGRAWRNALGVPAWMVDGWLGSYEAIGAGELAQVSSAVSEILDRPPAGLDAYFARRLDLLAAIAITERAG
jgi:NAD(P)H dehydrogenase (quinone)